MLIRLHHTFHDLLLRTALLVLPALLKQKLHGQCLLLGDLRDPDRIPASDQALRRPLWPPPTTQMVAHSLHLGLFACLPMLADSATLGPLAVRAGVPRGCVAVHHARNEYPKSFQRVATFRLPLRIHAPQWLHTGWVLAVGRSCIRINRADSALSFCQPLANSDQHHPSYQA